RLTRWRLLQLHFDDAGRAVDEVLAGVQPAPWAPCHLPFAPALPLDLAILVPKLQLDRVEIDHDPIEFVTVQRSPGSRLIGQKKHADKLVFELDAVWRRLRGGSCAEKHYRRE